jgi:hypothetical protein
MAVTLQGNREPSLPKAVVGRDGQQRERDVDLRTAIENDHAETMLCVWRAHDGPEADLRLDRRLRAHVLTGTYVYNEGK